MMHGFEFYTPTRVIFGAGSLEKLPEAVGRCGAKRVFVIYGGQSAKKSGTLDRVEALLTGAGIAFAAIGGVKPNPRLGLAREAIREAIAFGADLILAVGGGSVIDTAKATAHGTANPEADIWDIWMGKVKLEKSLPVGVVLTIPAAGSEMSDSAVLTDEAALAKRGLNTDLNRPAFALMDPALAATLPARQAACGVTDIMMHTLERYVNPLENDMTDEIAEALLKLDVGITLLNGEGAFTGRTKKIILCVMRKSLYPAARDVVRRIDKNAFMIVSSANEVFGEGFKRHDSADL